MHSRAGGRYYSGNAAVPRVCNRRSRALSCVLYGLTLSAIACRVSGPGTNEAVTPPVRRAPTHTPPLITVPALIVSSTDVVDVQELFLAGQTALRQGQPSRAARAFERILEHDPGGPFALRALFQGALAREQCGDLEGAASGFDELERRFPDAPLAVDAMIRGLRLRLHLEQWQRASALGAHFLERHPDAPVLGHILSHAARALDSVERGQSADAEHFVAKGLAIVDQLALDRAGKIPRDLAPLYFAEGELRRRQAEATILEGDVREFAARLEQRCERLLAAQSAYSNAMRAYDAHWSTMAGYRVGELYARLHEALMRIVAPRAGTERQRMLFEGAMRLRYSVLLAKASSMLEHTLALALRTGEDSEWVRRTERARAALVEASADEQVALDRLPFSRDDLQRALDDLSARGAGAAR
jgi:tetratricopeptide (TPR) repeat protein